ncbi:Hypothetical protein PBC10988_35590 [Planctomycetales bacterium 10988]|nr:Hypothetical protein PBC10988_35590 [Planctomycetales bacterium 10988]
MIHRIAFLSYETAFAPCGGVAAVMSHLPEAIQQRVGKPTILVTPLHYRIAKSQKLFSKMEFVGCVTVRHEGYPITIQVLRWIDKISWYFLLPDDPRYFAGVRHPYDVATWQEPGGAVLLRDSFLFGIAAAKALHIIAPGEPWHVMMQDWEAATAALALCHHPINHKLFLTLHNSYDAHTEEYDLFRFHLPSDGKGGRSLLERVLPHVERPVFTVSKQFAAEITEDVLQTRVIAPHLQSIFKRDPLRGIDNGPFVELAVPQEILSKEGDAAVQALRQWKGSRRRAFIDALKQVGDAARSGKEMPWGGFDPPWGSLPGFLEEVEHDEKMPWFVMGGRDDSRQKGYDVAARAVRLFLNDGGKGCFLFFPIPGDEGLAGLQFLRRLTEEEPFRRRVLIFPFRFREGFMAALQGSHFGLMPSLYEPFGAANEFYLNGTAGIGRATGGITQQIVPRRDGQSFAREIALRAQRYHEPAAPETGILYREADNLPTAVADWHGINRGEYELGREEMDRVRQRSRFPLFEGMVNGLQLALMDASHLYQEHPDEYARMLLAGIKHIQSRFSWEETANLYAQYLLQNS